MDGDTQQPTVVRDLNSDVGEFGFTVAGPFGEQRVRFWGDVPPAAPVESALAVVLLPAMAAGGELSIPGPLSPSFAAAFPTCRPSCRALRRHPRWSIAR